MSNATHRARIFAYHILTLCRAKPGDKFGLHFWGEVNVQVEAMGSPGDTVFTFNGKHVGNIHGAYRAYADLCAEALSCADSTGH
jgi:hypothetical protein